MNPETGEFHEVIAEEGSRPVIKETMKPVPQHWPIFKIGEEYEFKSTSLILEKIEGKDLLCSAPLLNLEEIMQLIGQTAKIKGHRFRIRKFKRDYLFLRPVKGLPKAYLER